MEGRLGSAGVEHRLDPPGLGCALRREALITTLSLANRL